MLGWNIVSWPRVFAEVRSRTCPLCPWTAGSSPEVSSCRRIPWRTQEADHPVGWWNHLSGCRWSCHRGLPPLTIFTFLSYIITLLISLYRAFRKLYSNNYLENIIANEKACMCKCVYTYSKCYVFECYIILNCGTLKRNSGLKPNKIIYLPCPYALRSVWRRFLNLCPTECWVQMGCLCTRTLPPPVRWKESQGPAWQSGREWVEVYSRWGFQVHQPWYQCSLSTWHLCYRRPHSQYWPWKEWGFLLQTAPGRSRTCLGTGTLDHRMLCSEIRPLHCRRQGSHLTHTAICDFGIYWNGNILQLINVYLRVF